MRSPCGTRKERAATGTTAQIEYPLAVAPYHEFAVVELGDRTGRTDRGVRYIGFGVGRFEHLRCAGFRVGVFFLADDVVLGRVRFEPSMHVPGQRIDLSPGRRQPK